jgi:pimeloyl-ACP methyl ester carboxylesterase
VYWGDRDPVIPVVHTTALASLLDGVTVTCFHGSGHFPHIERPAEFVESLSHFLDDPFARRARVRRAEERRLLATPAEALAP